MVQVKMTKDASSKSLKIMTGMLEGLDQDKDTHVGENIHTLKYFSLDIFICSFQWLKEDKILGQNRFNLYAKLI